MNSNRISMQVNEAKNKKSKDLFWQEQPRKPEFPYWVRSLWVFAKENCPNTERDREPLD